MRLALLIFFLCLYQKSLAQQNDKILSTVDSLLLDNQTALANEILEKAAISSKDMDEQLMLKIKKAEIHLAEQQYEKASNLLTAIQESNPSRFVLAQSQLVTGMLAMYQGRNDKAEESLQNAITAFENNNSSLDMAKALTALGLVYFNAGKTSQAEEQLLMAQKIRSSLLPKNHELLAASYNDLGLVYSKSDPDKALSNYEMALPIYESLHGKLHTKIAINYANTGVIYQNLELYGDAINNLENALSIWENLHVNGNPRKAFVFHQLGYTYQKMQNNIEAEHYYKLALAEYTQSYGSKHPDIANELNALGRLAAARKDYDEAISYYTIALESNLKDVSSDDVTALPSINNYYNGYYLLYSLLFRSEAYEDKHFGKTLKFSDLELSLNNLLVCDTLLDKLRQQSSNEADKISLGAIANDVYANGVRIATHMSEVAFRNKSRYIEMAFYFAEKSKSAVLLEAISDVSAKSFAGIPQAFLEEEKSLKSAIALCAQKLSQKPTVEEESNLRESLFTLNRQYQSFTETLENNYPEYYNLKFNSATPSIKKIQKLVDEKTGLLSYFIDDKNARLYIFSVSNKKLDIISHQLPEKFDKYLTGFRNGIYYQDEKTLAEVGNTLYKLLIPRLSNRVTELVVFPTGRLGVIPFEALVTKKASKRYKSLYYLVKDYSVRYEFSASLAIQKAGNQKNPNHAIFLCAPIQFSEKDNLMNLPGTEQEVNSISALFKQNNLKESIYTLAEANEGLVKSPKLKEFSLLHFATHGLVDETNPELSRIFLQTNSENEDGYLFSGEIYNLELKADLVTLSACETGLGKISKAEGVIGLSRALIYAGAKKIIVSYWSVADESTSKLMTDFYSQVLNNKSSFHESLRKVKLRMISSKTYAAPYYWAPFVLIGF